MASIRLAIASDLHYRVHEAGSPPRPDTAIAGEAADPMSSLLRMIKQDSSSSSLFKADYLICPGDISDKAKPAGFDAGWENLLKLKDALGAKHLLATTGNHEVYSRAEDVDNSPGNSERTIDPLAAVQRYGEYPCTCMTEDQRWVYWGRGYQLLEQPDALFLIVNSSHFHHTTRVNEFERGRISDVALALLRKELPSYIEKNRKRAFIALMHHHPIQHQPLDAPGDNRIDMINGPQLMEVLQETSVSWLVVHGHKHYGRLIRGQGSMNPPIVLAAGSFGASLTGIAPTRTRLQFYILDVEIHEQSIVPKAGGHVRAWSWTGLGWELATGCTHGLPDRCGYSTPQVDLSKAVDTLKSHLCTSVSPYTRWDEVLSGQPELGQLMPDDAKYLRKLLEAKEVKATWSEDEWFPKEVAK